MEITPGQEQANRTERLRRTAHLRDAIVLRAQERGDTAAQIARMLDMSVGHWYRLKKEPIRLGKLTLERLEGVAHYVRWPKIQVMVAVGWLRNAEIDEDVSAEGAVQAALERLARSGIANGTSTPITKAAADHQILMARLLIAAEGMAVKPM